MISKTMRGRRDQVEVRAFGFLIVILLLQFFPLPKLPGVNVAPDNFVFALCILLLGAQIVSFAAAVRGLAIVVVIMVLFGILGWVRNAILGVPVGSPAEHVRHAVIVLLTARVSAQPEMRTRVLKLLVVLGVAQVVIGSLIYFVGEPFSGIREWMLQSAGQPEDRIIGEGSQIASTYGAPHTFSYLLGSFPMLALLLYLVERRLHWLLAMGVLGFGLLLNAERAAAALLMVAIAVVWWKSGQSIRVAAAVVVLGVVFLAMHQVSQRDWGGAAAATQSVAFANKGTVVDRLGGSTVEEIYARVAYQGHGIMSVFKHPVLGPTPQEYAREVKGPRSFGVHDFAAFEVLAPHNHYVNVGMRLGVLGWALMLWVLVVLWRAGSASVARAAGVGGGARLQPLCVVLGLSVAMGIGLFHNAGLLSPELATTILVGLLFGIRISAASEFARSSRRPRGGLHLRGGGA